LANHGRALEGAQVTVLGVAFKPGTDDTRESPSIVVIDELLNAGAVVTAHDPIARIPEPRISWASSVNEALTGADAVVVMTTWSDYAGLADHLPGSGGPLVVDARRFLDPTSYDSYVGIGFGSTPKAIDHSR
jgi:UDPglucose 6-dehydrogenase